MEWIPSWLSLNFYSQFSLYFKDLNNRSLSEWDVTGERDRMIASFCSWFWLWRLRLQVQKVSLTCREILFYPELQKRRPWSCLDLSSGSVAFCLESFSLNYFQFLYINIYIFFHILYFNAGAYCHTALAGRWKEHCCGARSPVCFRPETLDGTYILMMLMRRLGSCRMKL